MILRKLVSVAGIVIATLAAEAWQSPVAGLFRERKFHEAEREIRASLKKQPRQPWLRILFARTLIELNRIPEALAELEYLLDNKSSAETEMEAGRLLRQLAEKRFRDLSASGAGRAAVNEIAGRRLEREGDFGAALARYEEALRLEPNRPGLRYSIGSALWKMRELDSAEKNLRAELERTPEHGMANFRLGQVMIATNREAAAAPYLERAYAALPERLEVRRELGKAYRKAGRSADARTAWETVANARPTDDQVHFLLGGLYRELGETALAQREFRLHRKLLEQRRNHAERR